MLKYVLHEIQAVFLQMLIQYRYSTFFQGQVFLTPLCTEPCMMKHYVRSQKQDQKLKSEN